LKEIYDRKLLSLLRLSKATSYGWSSGPAPISGYFGMNIWVEGLDDQTLGLLAEAHYQLMSGSSSRTSFHHMGQFEGYYRGK
jgi:hypothetical protein